MSAENDISIAGPGSPPSLKKFIANTPDLRELTLIVNGTGMGLIKDEEGMVYITPEECKTQTLHYVKTIFDGRRIPAYLFRYLHYLMIDSDGYGGMKYPTDQSVIDALTNGSLSEQHEDYVFIKNFITYAEHNTEALQIIGFIQLVGGTLNLARKKGGHVRLYIEQPETGLHPKRQSRLMSALMSLRQDYGYNEEVQPAHDVDGD